MGRSLTAPLETRSSPFLPRRAVLRLHTSCRQRDSARVDLKLVAQFLSAADICRLVAPSCALWGVEKHPWAPPTRYQ